MLFYPGGKYSDHNSQGYSFLENFFSDLGRWRTYNGGTKWISFILFVYALAFLAIAVCVFIFEFLASLNDSRKYPVVYYSAIASAFLYAIFSIGIACTPYDLGLAAHMFVVRSCFIMMVPLTWSISFLIYKHNEIPNRYFVLLLTVSFMLIAYIYILFWGPRVNVNTYFQPVAQKIIVYTLTFSLMYLSLGSKQHLTRK